MPVDVPAILVGEEIVTAAVDVPVVVSGVVDGGRRGYLLPSGHHLHCPGMAMAGGRRPSGGSSAARDRTTVVGWLGFRLG